MAEEKKLFKTFSNTLDELKANNFFSKRNIIMALVLGIIVFSLPIGVKLAQQTQQLKSRANEECDAGDAQYCDNGKKIWKHAGYKDEEGVCQYAYNEIGACDIGGGGSNPSPTQPPAGGSCDIAGKQNPSVGDQCTACIASSNSGLIDSIKGSCTVSSSGKSDTELINFWCNGGVGEAAAQDCNTKKAACGSVCGGSGNGAPFCTASAAALSISPSNPKVGDEVTFAVSGSQGSTCTGDEFSDQTFVQPLRDDFSNGYKKIFKMLKPGTFTWTHQWRNTPPNNATCDPTQASAVCSSTPLTITVIGGSSGNSASCGAFTVDNVIASQPFNVSITMNNPVGAKSWDNAANYRLGRWDGNGNNSWLLPDTNHDRVIIPNSPVNGGSSVTFNFSVTAPATTGSKDLELRMVQDGAEWFGDICKKTINVTAISTTLSPTLTLTGTTTPTPPAFGAKCIASNDNYFTQWLTYIQVGRIDANSNIDKDYDCDGNNILDIIDYNIWRNRKFNLSL